MDMLGLFRSDRIRVLEKGETGKKRSLAEKTPEKFYNSKKSHTFAGRLLSVSFK
jgi:hypothetical protein